MIIRCPECSTGFKLPDDRVTDKRIKVRCSRCEHLFRVGRLNGAPTVFDISGDPLDDQQGLITLESDDDSPASTDDPANQTQIGGPAASLDEDGPSPGADDPDEDYEDYEAGPGTQIGLGGPAPTTGEASEASDASAPATQTQLGTPLGESDGPGHDDSGMKSGIDSGPEDADSQTRAGAPLANREQDPDSTRLGAPTAGGGSPDPASKTDNGDNDDKDRTRAASSGGDTTRAGGPRGPGEDRGSGSGTSGAGVIKPSASQKKSEQRDPDKPSSPDSAASGYNPFPHANASDIAPQKSRAIRDDEENDADTPAPAEPEERDQDEDLALFEESSAGDDPFAGAFEDEKTKIGTGEPAEKSRDEDSDPLAVDDDFDGDDFDRDDSGASELELDSEAFPGRDPLAQQEESSDSDPDDLDSLEIDDELPQDDDSFWAKQDDESDFGVDEFEGQRDYFDPEAADTQPPEQADPEPPAGARSGGGPQSTAPQASPDDSTPATDEAPREPARTTDNTSQPRQAAGQTAGQTSPQADQRSPATRSTGPASDAATGGSTRTGSQQTASQQTASHQQTDAPPTDAASSTSGHGASWTSDDLDRLDGAYRAGGFQKFANVLLILLLVASGFLAFVAFKNQWHLDFLKFRQMLQVALQNGEYEPREAWQKETKPARKPPEDPIRFENVVAQKVPLTGESGEVTEQTPRVLVLRGTARNVDSTDYLGVRVRGLIYDKDDRRLTETVAPVGTDIPLSTIRGASSLKDARSLTLADAPRLKANRTQPFTLIFTELPAPVTNDGDYQFGVEIARKISANDGTE